MKKTIAIQNRAILKPSSREVAIEEIQNSEIRDEFKEQFIKIAQNDTGENINLVNKDIGIKEAVYLAKALRENISLKKINLTCNPLQAEGVCYLAEALKVNSSLESVILHEVHIGPEGANYLTEMLKVNRSLKEIQLYHNNIGNEGASHFADVLTMNSSLEVIELGADIIGDEGVKHLSDAIKKNRGLRKIALVANKIGIIGAKAIKEALDVNTLLEEVKIFSNYKIGHNLEMEIRDKVLRNKALNKILKGSPEEVEGVIGEVRPATAKLWILEKVEKALEAYLKNIHIDLFSLKFECLKLISDAEDGGTLIEQVGFTSKKEAEELTKQILRYKKIKTLCGLPFSEQKK